MAKSNKLRENAVLMEISTLLADRFRPLVRGAIPDESWTLHSAVREVFGADSALGLVAYANHRALRHEIAATYAALDAALHSLGIDGRAEPWSLDEDRTPQELAELSRVAASIAGSGSPQQISAAARPRISKLTGVGKYRGAICCVIAEVAESRGSSVGEVVDWVLQLGAMSDSDLLEQLEQLDRAMPGSDRGAEAARISVSAGTWLGPGRPTMSAYFGAVAEFLGGWTAVSPLADGLDEFDKEIKRSKDGTQADEVRELVD